MEKKRRKSFLLGENVSKLWILAHLKILADLFFNTCNVWYVERVLRNTCN